MHRGARNPLRVLAPLWARLNAVNHHRCDHHAGICSHTRAADLAADDLTRDYL